MRVGKFALTLKAFNRILYLTRGSENRFSFRVRSAVQVIHYYSLTIALSFSV